MDQGAGQRAYRLTVWCLAAAAVVLMAYPAIRMGWNYEIDNTEGWNAYHQLRAMAGLPLYEGGSPLFFNNYPPLSFYLVGALSLPFGDPVIAGRILSLLGLVAICLSAGSVVRSAGGSRLDGTLAASTCALIFATFIADHVAKNNPQLLAIAFIMAGLATHLGGRPGIGRAAATALLFSIGVMTKHSLICVPLVVAGDVLINGRGRPRLAFFGFGLGLAVLCGGAMWVFAGKAFFVQLLASRTWEVDRSFLFTTEILGQFQAPMAVVGLGLIHFRRHRPAGLILAYLGASLAFGIFYSGGAGTDINVYFDVFIALSIGAGLVAHLLPVRRARAVVALALNAGVLFYTPFSLGRFGWEMMGEMTYRERLFQEDVDYVAAIPGVALCHSHLLCLRAGKPAFYDPINVLQAMIAGRLPADTLTGMLRRHEIQVVELSDPPRHPEDENPGLPGLPTRFMDFPDDVFEALRQEYVIDRIGISGRFYRPRTDQSPPGK
ncbi:hypothetical protein CU669_03820 [Paramagnetospirillum kuznetsovii]|uniref:Glycosyltransferase RgtA/B/C/D-like domain-containing protein n=2 Tax=Paramagnetospirillum kuznetsovii TaxID=2053833 RepID=A0A364P2I3_9PROT|nr:hypothetical protein CU669_03820 [Paramagnetospirillum kuznetsovii]